MISDSALNLLFKAKADTKEAQKAFEDLDKSIDKTTDETGKLSGATDGLSGSFKNFVNPAAVASAAITGITATIAGLTVAAVATSRVIINLSRNFADLGSEIGKAQQKTGLSAESLSALKIQAERAGLSFDELQDSIGSFTLTLAEAQQGSDSAKEKLVRLGLDPKEPIGNLDEALGKVFERINSLKNPIERAAAANDAFGESGKNLLPFIAKFDGDLEKLIAKAKEFGLVLSEEDVKASQEFNRSLKDAQTALRGLGVTFGREFLPIVAEGFNDINGYLKTNQTEVKIWAESFALGTSGVINSLKRVLKFYSDNKTTFDIVIRALSFGATAGYSEFGRGVGTIIRNQGTLSAGMSGGMTSGSDLVDTGYNKNVKAQKQAAEKAARERDQIQKRELSAQITILKNQLDEAENAFKDTFDNLVKEFKSTGNKGVFDTALQQATGIINSEVDKILPQLNALEIRAATKAKATLAEFELLQQQQDKRLSDHQKIRTDIIEKAAAANTEINKKVADEAKKATEEEIRTAEVATQRKLALRRAEEALEIETARSKIKNEVELATQIQEIQKETFFQKKQALREEMLLNTENTSSIQFQIDILEKEFAAFLVRSARELEILREKKAEREKILSLVMEQARIEAGGEQESATAGEAESGGLFGGLFGDLKENTKTFETFGNFVTTIGGTITETFYAMADAIGASIEQWVLYGGSVGKALKQVLAQSLAATAAQAAVEAIKATALGFFHLASFNFPAAGLAFKSAALWGSLAIGSALAGRAVAGDSFSRESSGGFGSSGGNIIGNSSSGTSSSSSSPKIIEENRIQRQEQVVKVVEARIPRGLFTKHFLDDLNSAGEMRDGILRIVEG